eukprot:TRINITY_DN65172_c1_g2_i2.p1 TRINITY_DN65172_c1_g2~~TRINITY_DN65172_c1_g2_i2.p1  ORF type:complete len:351 (-),score=64.25 TRINITY_DN65172_c1_g2_i2:162-1073(-)
MNELFDQHDKVIVVGVDNVGSGQLQHIRMALRGKAEVLLGKNTMMKRCLDNRKEERGGDRDKEIFTKFVTDRLISGNMGLIFTNGDLGEVKEIASKFRVQAPAKAGSVAPVNVTVPAGNTGLEPTKTQFFQALNIPTKITRGTVEILKDEQVVTAGEKVGSSEATLLQMLKIKPFYYGLEIKKIYDNGSVYGPQVLEWTGDDIRQKFVDGASRVKALGLGLGIPTKATIDNIVLNAFKNILAVSVMTDYTFEEFDGAALKDSVLNGPKIVASAAPAAAAASAAPAKKEEESEEEEDMGFGLFD